MIKPKAINCNYSAGRFCFAHLQNLIGAQIRKVETEFEKYRVIQDRLFMSDFDKYMLELEENAKK